MKLRVLKPFLLTLIVASLVTSCSIEKRRYSAGYSVDFHFDKKHRSKSSTEITTKNYRSKRQTIVLNENQRQVEVVKFSKQPLLLNSLIERSVISNVVQKISSNQISNSVLHPISNIKSKGVKSKNVGAEGFSLARGLAISFIGVFASLLVTSWVLGWGTALTAAFFIALVVVVIIVIVSTTSDPTRHHNMD